ncbi:MAG: amidohydrolase family protein, partial [Bacteroidota bacterium]
MPGLVDMHVHINNAKDLDLFVANGVTAVQNMWGYEGLLNLFGFSNQLRLKTQIDSGKRLGPSIYTAGPILEGHPKTQPFMTETTDPRAAVRLVRSHREKGYDFVKVYDHLHEGVYLSIMEECRRLRMPVKGHVPYGVGILQALQWGQRQIDHLTGYLDYDMVKLLLPEEQLAEYARLTREYEVYNCPTVVFTQKRVGMAKFHEMSKHPAMKHLNFMQKLFLRKSVASLEEELRYQGQDYQRDVFELYKTVIHALQQENAPILAGTDTGNPFVFPGYALHEELELLVRAGMSPYEALSCATVRPYESLGMIDKAGTIEVGKRADLIILRKNPLDDISGITQIEGVILKGKLLSRDCLNELLN